jgi:hypothetical protein
MRSPAWPQTLIQTQGERGKECRHRVTSAVPPPSPSTPLGPSILGHVDTAVFGWIDNELKSNDVPARCCSLACPFGFGWRAGSVRDVIQRDVVGIPDTLCLISIAQFERAGKELTVDEVM